MKVRPLHDRILVKQLDEKELKNGSIIIPDSAKTKPSEGEVIAVGDGKINKDGTKRPLDVKKGDKVIYGKYAATEVKIDGVEYLLMKEEDVLAIVE